MGQVHRRQFLNAAGVLLAAPLTSFAQQPGKVWRIGFLSIASGPNRAAEAFREQLRGLGYIEGRNLLIEYRLTAGKDERLPEMAAELVRLKADVIVTQGALPTLAAKRATSTIPIVMAAVADPVGAGLIASLARPGGNITGTTVISTELAGKQVQLVRELLPKATRVAVLTYKRSQGTSLFIEEIRTVARQMGITLVAQQVSGAEALTGAFAAMARERAQALIVQSNPFAVDHRKRIVELAAQHRLPAIFESRAFVDVDGLVSYGSNLLEVHRRTALYVDRILKGAKPADLPVEQPTKFQMIINLKTAKALGLTIPQTVLLRVDEVIK